MITTKDVDTAIMVCDTQYRHYTDQIERRKKNATAKELAQWASRAEAFRAAKHTLDIEFGRPLIV